MIKSRRNEFYTLILIAILCAILGYEFTTKPNAISKKKSSNVEPLTPYNSKEKKEWAKHIALNKITLTTNGVELTHPNYKVNFTRETLLVTPTSGAPAWSWSSNDQYDSKPYYNKEHSKVVYNRQFWQEEYLLKEQSIEQQIVIPRPVTTESPLLRIEGKIQCDGIFSSTKKGWSWRNEIGEITLGDVYVFDANRKQIPAKMLVTASESSIEIATADLRNVAYPITIDPEIGTNDFRISYMGTDGDNTNYSALNPAVAHCITNNPGTYPEGVYLVVWEGSVTGEIEIYGQFIDGATGALLDANVDPIKTDIKISNMNNSTNANFDALKPDVVSSGTKFLVVWHGDDVTDNEYEIYGQLLDPITRTEEGSDFKISNMGTPSDPAYGAFDASVAFNNTNDKYLVVWYGDNSVDNDFEIYSKEVPESGGVTPGQSVVSATGFGAFGPRLIWNSAPATNEYLVTFYGDNAVDNEFEIFVHRIDGATGSELGLDVKISDMGPDGSTTFNALNPAIACNPAGGTHSYLVVWQGDDDTSPLIDEENEIFGQFLTAAAAQTGSDFRISNMGPNGDATYDAAIPKISFDPNLQEFFVVWHGDDNASTVEGENEIFGQLISNTGLDIGSDFRLSDAGGLTNTTYAATGASIIYNPTNRENLIVWRGDDNSTTTVDNENEIWGQHFADLSTEPTAQPTTPVFTSITPSSFTINFTAAAGTPDGYIALRRSGSSPTDVPADHTVYTVGNSIGTSMVAYIGSTLTFSESSLSSGTAYHYDIFAYNGVNSSTNYRTATPLEGSTTTLSVEPAGQPSTLVISVPTTSSLNLSFTAASGTPTGYIVLRRPGSAVADVPVDATTYTAGNGIGTSTVAYVGTAPGFTDAGLSSNTVHHYAVFSYNGSGVTLNYRTASPLIGNRTTLQTQPASQPTLLTFNTVASTSMNGSFTAAAGSPTGYIVLRKASSSPTETPDDGSVYSVGATLGLSTVVHVGATTTFSNTGLSAAVVYHYDVFSFSGGSGAINYLTSSPLEASQVTTAVEPTAQPTALVISAPTTSSLNFSFTAASGTLTGYIVLRKLGSAPTDVPVDATAYTAGNTIGTSTVAYVGATAGFNDTGLSSNTVYHYAVFSYNGSSTTLNYRTASPLTGNRTTLQTQPASQPTLLTFNSITSSSMDGSFTAAAGTPTGYIVLRKAGSSPTDIPDDGTAYSVGATIGTSTVVHVGAPTTFSSTGLSSGVVYHYDVFSVNGSSGAFNYLTLSPLEGSQVTTVVEPTAQPTALSFGSATPSSIDITFAAATGSPGGYIVLRKSGSSPTDVPLDGVSYTAGNTIGTSTVAYMGSSLGFTDTGLAACTEYFYDIFSFNGSGTTANYLVASPLQSSKSTIVAEPTAQTASITFSSHTTATYTVNFTTATGAPTGYIAIRKTGSAPTGVPADGTTYAIGNPIGDGVVAFTGSALTFNETGLVPGTNYFYKIYSFNGAASCINYLTTSPPESSTITLCEKPSAITISAIGQDRFTMSWPAVFGASSYKLDVSKDDFSTLVGGAAQTVNTGTNPLVKEVLSLESGVTYKYRVRAVNASGESANSDIGSTITIPGTPAIKSPREEISQTSFKITWDAISGASKYVLDVSLSADFQGTVLEFESTTTDLTLTGLSAGITYHFRLRSQNNSGTSPNSPAVSQATFPGTPAPSVIQADIDDDSFKVTWSATSGATSYELEVSQNNFTSLLPDYNPAVITSGLDKVVIGLQANTVYQIRMRSKNAGGFYSPYSATVSVETKQPSNANPLSATADTQNLQQVAQGFGTIKLKVNVAGGNPPYTVMFRHRKIMDSDMASVAMTLVSGTYEVSVTESMFDDFGLEYYFEIRDQKPTDVQEPKTTHSFIYKEIGLSQKIEGLSSGGKAENYRIISIPYDLEDRSAQTLFGHIGDFGDKTKWRLVHYENGRNNDVQGFSNIAVGYGYWLNSISPVEVTIKNGTAPKYNQSTPFTLSLAQGWNQIGNPYPFPIDWADIKAANPSVQVGNLKIFDASKIGLKTSDDLLKWSGGFVFADVAGTLTFPVALKNTYAAGRKSKDGIINSSLDQLEWLLPLTLQHGIGANDMIGIGMHPDASEGKDHFDEISVPRFVRYLEMETKHEEYFAPYFTRDVVPNADQYTWNFTVHSNFGEEKATLTWNAESLGNNLAKLILYDVEAQQFIDMKIVNQYSFSVGDGRKFKFVYTNNGAQWKPDFTTLGKPYPNPTASGVTVQLIVKSSETPVVVNVFDMVGKPVRTIINKTFDRGIYDLTWHGDDYSSASVSSGVYFLEAKIGNQKIVHKVTMK